MTSEFLRLYRIWNIFITLCVVLVAIEVPVRLVLTYYEHLAVVYIEWAVTFLFLIDILYFYHRSEVSKSRNVESQSQKAYYTTSWFFLDVLAFVPFYLLNGHTLLQLFRLVKLIRVAQMMQQWRQHAVEKSTILRLVFFIFWFALVAHWLACGWLAIRGLDPDMTRGTNYLYSIYWCITTLATVGYGDITPVTNGQILYAMMVMILGVGIYGYVIGNVASLLANIDQAKAEYRAKLERLSTFMNYRHIPLLLQRRIYDYYAYLWENRLGYDESSVLSELPLTLRTEVSLALKQEFIEKVPFFKDASQEFIRSIALELQPIVFIPGDYICKAGEIGRQMYFVSRGIIEIVALDGETVLATLKGGDIFGEMALLFSQPRTASVRAVTYCDLYALDKDTLDLTLAHYPDFAATIQEIARKRQESNK